MIRITKPQQGPAVLISKGNPKREAHCQDYVLYKAEYDSGQRRFDFDSSIYGHKTVKQALMKSQHGKCCYCESKAGKYDDIEHFRPKACYQQQADDFCQPPGYYALVYDWDNLLVSCAECNRGFKKNLFPLADPAKRANLHTDDIARETPLLINPAQQDPEEYITFELQAPIAVKNNPVGRATIKTLGLDREELNNERREVLNEIFDKRDILLYLEGLPPSAERDRHILKQKAFLERAVSDSSRFACMARAAKKYDFLRPLL